VGAAVDAVGVARTKPLDQELVPRSFEQEALVAVAEDLATSTGTVGQRREQLEQP
jgi:hypothetical protein